MIITLSHHVDKIYKLICIRKMNFQENFVNTAIMQNKTSAAKNTSIYDL